MSNEATAPVHYKSMFQGDKTSPYLFACHLGFNDLTVTIKSVVEGKIKGTGGLESGKPVIHFVESGVRPLALNKTNGAAIVSLYGTPKVSEWVGKRITLYPTVTTFGKDTVECIRIRPIVPPAPRGEFSIDDALAEIGAADTPTKLSECKAWLNETARPPAKYKPQIKAALDDRAAKNDVEAQQRATRTEDREPGADDE